MEESREIQKLHGFLQCTIYLMVIVEIVIYVYAKAPFLGLFSYVVAKLSLIPIYTNLLYSKLATLVLICLVSMGTLAKKKTDLNPKKHIVFPLCLGLICFFGSLWIYGKPSHLVFAYTRWSDLIYMCCSIFGALAISLSMDNISKMIRSGIGKDKWNVEQESFMQAIEKKETEASINIPMQFYYKGKVHNGWINCCNLYRALMTIGTPGSGKTFGVINPAIKQLLGKKKPFCLCVYDYKHPDLGKIAYHHYLLAKTSGRGADMNFHVINLSNVERSRRVNPLRCTYLNTLADANETAEGLVEALKKGDKSGGSDLFFTQSAINFAASCIYFFAKYNGGTYSTFAHVLSFLNRSYDEIFTILFTNPELGSLLSPFRSAFKLKAYDQLEGQIGTLKIFISRLATKESFWVFSGDDINLKFSDPNEPSVIVLANDPTTQNVNSTCYSVILNRMVKLINTKGNRPCAMVVDELPSIFINKLEVPLSVARSNKVGFLLGLQELTQFKQQYGKDTSDTITSVIGSVLSGAVRNKDTLDWLERLLGKSKQISENLSIDRNKTSTSLNERLESLVPAGKIASLNTGEMVGLIASEPEEKYDGKFETSAVHCRINLDLKAIAAEERLYKDLPVYYDFGDKKEKILMNNFLKINQQIEDMVSSFMNPV
jgi:hypothetical protein